MLRFAFRLQPRVQGVVHERSDSLLSKLGAQFVGVHIRRGDQCQPSALRRKHTVCYDLADYMAR